jgi:hypothetical protein
MYKIRVLANILTSKATAVFIMVHLQDVVLHLKNQAAAVKAAFFILV